MNYRHIYHAGNFADVFKHIVLSLLITHLKRKEKAFRVYDTHAGIGVYRLDSDEAQKTGEWRTGIGRLFAHLDQLDGGFRQIAADYLNIIERLNPNASSGIIDRYPGSPALTRALMRPQDRLSVFEKHPRDFETLKQNLEGDYQVRVTHLDGWLVPAAQLPPKEKRGLLFIDPPFEDGRDFDRALDVFSLVQKRWREGMICFWYPLKREDDVAAFERRVAELELGETLSARFQITSPSPDHNSFYGCGLIIKNPPFTLIDDLEVLAPGLVQTLAGPGGVAKGAQLTAAML